MNCNKVQRSDQIIDKHIIIIIIRDIRLFFILQIVL